MSTTATATAAAPRARRTRTTAAAVAAVPAPADVVAKVAAYAGDYTTAPACGLIAVRCACCGKELLDAESVEAGMGPVCRVKHGYKGPDGEADWLRFAIALGAAVAANPRMAEVSAALTKEGRLSDPRKAANLLVHRVALYETGTDVAHLTAAIAALGWRKLAGRIAARLGMVKVETETLDGVECFVAYLPYNETLIAAMRHVPGRRVDKRGKATVNVVPVAHRAPFLAALRAVLDADTLVVSAKGVNVLGAAKKAS